jgi:membrane protease YdiL (CAAX protease family)
VLSKRQWHPESLITFGASLMITLGLGGSIAGLLENESAEQMVANILVLPVAILISLFVWFQVNRKFYNVPMSFSDTFGFHRKKLLQCMVSGLIVGVSLVLTAMLLAFVSAKIIETLGKDAGLASLDEDNNGIITIEEWQNVDKALVSLDVNQDGQLSKEEIMDKSNIFGDASSLIVLDTNEDMMISKEEIQNAAVNLASLDKNNDGQLSGGEITTKANPQKLVIFIANLVEKKQYMMLGFFVCMAVLVAPIVEEILFRGILYPAIKQIGFPRLAAISTAIIFALFHVNLVTFASLTAVALGLIFLYEYTDNLLAPIIAHAVFNTSNVLMIFLSSGQASASSSTIW